MVKTSAFTSEMMLMPSGTPFRGSDLQRQYRTVLDCARKSPVTLVDSDGHRLAVADWDEVSIAWTFMRLLDTVAQFRLPRQRDGHVLHGALKQSLPELAEPAPSQAQR
ncbi:MAG: hypothetical protein ACR2NB_00030 [Solirubrobacteraceae bacterium]